MLHYEGNHLGERLFFYLSCNWVLNTIILDSVMSLKGRLDMNFGRSTPTNLAYYEVLLRRAICDERSMRELQTKYYNLRSGYAGERRVDNEWREVNVPGIVLHDFTCRNEFGNSHQMDTLFICKHFVLVVEVKNISGRIDFDDQRRQFCARAKTVKLRVS